MKLWLFFAAVVLALLATQINFFWLLVICVVISTIAMVIAVLKLWRFR